MRAWFFRGERHRRSVLDQQYHQYLDLARHALKNRDVEGYRRLTQAAMRIRNDLQQLAS